MTELLRVAGIPIFWDGKTISFTAGMTIDADGGHHAYHPDSKRGLDDLANAGHPGNWWGIATDKSGKPFIQTKDDPAPGFYVSTTTYQRRQFAASDPRRYVNSEEVPYVVIPPQIRSAVPPKFMGCWCEVLYRGVGVTAVCADGGPKNHLGEGSIKLAELLRFSGNPRTGGVDGGVLYKLHPGTPAPLSEHGLPFELQ